MRFTGRRIVIKIELKLTISEALVRCSRDRHNTSQKTHVFVARGLDFLMTFWYTFSWTFFDPNDGLTGPEGGTRRGGYFTGPLVGGP